jgi:hypothetical protein
MYENQNLFMDTPMEDLVVDIRDWSIDRFSKLTKKNKFEDAIALEEEFSEWLGSGLDGDIEVMTID